MMTLTPALPPCSVLLLCGGRGQRMGGHDKGLLHWHGQPLVAWLANHAAPMSDDLLISCNRNASRYAHFTSRLISDGNDDFAGPLAGIRAGLAQCHHERLLVLSCDAPKVSAEILNALRACSAAHQNQAALVKHGSQWQPLISLWPRTLLAALEAAWQAGERSPLRFLLAHQAQPLQYPSHDERFVNLNTPEQLHAIVP
ncbi:molybdenum cofactor guanylyltransferase [Paraperlucidibaca baekdonensis]|uniref:Molybdenum cofactor guanylyltransferase n=1 Tax=Paraperlucidibaca baekdonensis TaxID=748120 RepID=A0A3E0H687_9GAMM|nr:molybdenum cofactor guanylyltransferase MobA [Paraperlucidibaca baekdonensis]REH38979.1 molybdenum cofactor guanylyltransferase [Paraperlucidibaca baekdonensis]